MENKEDVIVEISCSVGVEEEGGSGIQTTEKHDLEQNLETSSSREWDINKRRLLKPDHSGNRRKQDDDKKVDKDSDPLLHMKPQREGGFVLPGTELDGVKKQDEILKFQKNMTMDGSDSKIYQETKRLLDLRIDFEHPAPLTIKEMNDLDAVGNYTARKMAYWFLKEEEDPPDYVKIHPELHDDENFDEECEGNFIILSEREKREVEEDIGFVSDPEGKFVQEDHFIKRKKIDPDIVDEYCGFTLLGAKIFRLDKPELQYRNLFKTMEGTAYDKHILEAVCFMCKRASTSSKFYKIHGQRELGAHIRSEQHKKAFRKFSLDFANYKEERIATVRKKVFKAKLFHYPPQTSKSKTF